MTLEGTCLKCIEELEGAIKLNGAFVSDQLLRIDDVLLPNEVLSLVNALGHGIVLEQVENLTFVHCIFVCDAHWFKVTWYEVRMRNLFDLELLHKREVSSLHNPLQHVDRPKLIDYEKVVSLEFEPQTPLCLELEYWIVASQETVSGVNLHDAALPRDLHHVVEEVPLVLDHRHVF